MISGNLCHFIIKSTEIFSLPSPFFYSFIYFWLHWVFVGVHRLSTVEGSGGQWRAVATLPCGAWVSCCGGFSCYSAWTLGAWAQ